MITWSYIAGFLDGDGWITKSKLKSGRPVYLAGVTQVVLQKKQMLKIHQFLIENDINAKFKIRKKNNWKSSLKMINITVKEQKSLLKFLLKIEPYLLIKKLLAKETICYLKKRIEIRNLKYKPPAGKKIKWLKKDYEKLQILVNSGMSNIEISHELNRGTQSVASKISKLGIFRKYNG